MPVFRTRVLASLLLAAVAVSCKEHIADNPSADQPPKTFLWVYPQSEIRTVVSKESLHWWGEDPDGVVRGFLFAFRIVDNTVSSVPVPDTQRYTWTTSTDTTILFPLDTLFRRFAVTVRAVDNTFRGLPEKSIVRLQPFPYADNNDNGIFDGNDERLPDLAASMDPRGAVVTFPIINSPPSVGFVPNPLDPTQLLTQPDTTFTVATFAWSGNDPDGRNTLKGYRIALNDTSSPGNWLSLSLRDSMVTLVVPRVRSDAAVTTVTADVYRGTFLGQQLVGQLPGMKLDSPNIFFVEALDVAGEYSAAASLPSPGDVWFVKKPRGRMLLVSDYIDFDADTARERYRAALAAVPGGNFTPVDVLDIGLGLSQGDKLNGKAGALVPPFVDPALINTFLLYDYVFWYTDKFPGLAIAQRSLFAYIQNGGKVIFSTSFLNSADPGGALKDFAPIDSVSSVDLTQPPPLAGDSRLPPGLVVLPDSSAAGGAYPQLAFGNPQAPATFHSVFMRPIYKRTDARYLYHLQADPRPTLRYFGAPNIAVVDGQSKIIFIGLPLHLLNNTSAGAGLTAFFTRVITREFNPSQIVNRARF